jgi:serine/threonine protein kinase
MGILIYEMLVGSTPKAVLESELMAPLPESIRPVVRQCLMQNPENRYQSVEDLKEALIKSQQPISIPEQGTKTSPLIPIVTIAGIGLALGAGVIYFLSNDEPDKQIPNKPLIVAELNDASKPPKVIALPDSNQLSLIALLADLLQPDRGNWSLSEDGKLTCSRTPNASCLSFPVNDLGNEYDLSFNIIRSAGTNSFAIYLPTSCGSVTFELDAWNLGLAGIQALDGLDLRQQDQNFKFSMTNGQSYHLLIKVRKDHVEVEIDGATLYHRDISGKQGSVIDLWDLPRKHPLSVGVWNSSMTFSELVLKKIP